MIQGLDYVPLLHGKRAELKALASLEKSTRERIFPIVAVRPWPNAKDLSVAYAKVDEATAGYRHGWDIDRFKKNRVEIEPAGRDFDSLFSSANGYENYYALVKRNELRVPVLRDTNGLFENVNEQFDRIDSLHRGVIIRIQRGYTRAISDVINSGRLIADDVLFVVDAGWSLDVLAQEAWASAMVRLISDWDPSAEIVCVSSSFPNSFSHIEYKGAFSIDDRELFSRLARQHNSAHLIYGDWGSTRQPEETGGGTHYDRIDIANSGEWISYRQTGDEVGYKVVAERALADPVWHSLPACWGRHAVQCTAMDIPGKIRGTEGAAASRINMHITVQAAAGTPMPPEDEPYLDKF
jgi:hypothetical protein